ncbi:MAG: transposase [Syntrophobacteraceae bacterium]
MKKNIAFSLSVQKEIENRRLNIESEINKSMNELGIRTLLHRSGIQKEKGYSTVTPLFALLVLPVIKHSIVALWSGKFFENLIHAQKDTYYRFLNHPCFNWRKLVALLACREIARTDEASLNQKLIIADDSLLGKTGANMELVSYHHDHTTNGTKLGYQMLQIGYHNGTRFYPPDMGFHTSKNRPNDKLQELDKRSSGWKRRMESFEKKTDLLVQMIRRCRQNGINARFVLFDSWFACDKVISKILSLGHDVICRLKRNKTRYSYQDQSMTLAQLWHNVARHELRWISSWQIRAAILNVELPLTGKVSIVFVRWTKNNRHAFLCTEADMETAEIINYSSRRWAIECYFRDCKQLLGLGKGQSETFDAVVACASIVMIRYLILVYILSKRQLAGPIGPLFQELAREHLQLAMIQSLWTRIRQILMLSSRLFSSNSDLDELSYLLDIIEYSLIDCQVEGCAKL